VASKVAEGGQVGLLCTHRTSTSGVSVPTVYRDKSNGGRNSCSAPLGCQCVLALLGCFLVFVIQHVLPRGELFLQPLVVCLVAGFTLVNRGPPSVTLNYPPTHLAW
jgi:hypothetical protein